MTDRETAHSLRGIVTRGVVTGSDDAGEMQAVDVQARAGAPMTGVEVAQPFGFASRAPDGGLVILLAVGGDQGDLVALPISSPRSRIGGLGAGDSVLYSADGSRVLVRADGTIEVTSSRKVTVKTPGASLEVSESLVRGQLDSGERFVAAPGLAKLATSAHFLAVTSAGLVSSAPVTVGPDPAPDK